ANGGTGAASTSQNFIFAGPASGSGAPSFRALAASDLPASASYWAAATGGINYASGNVGIGSATPGEKLTVSNAGAVYTSLRDSSGTPTTLGTFANSTSGAAGLYTVSNHPLIFGTNNNVSGQMALSTAGFLGVGTSTPGYNFHVKTTAGIADARMEATSFGKISFKTTSGGTDQKVWQTYGAPGMYRIGAVNDAENAETVGMQINRGTGTAITQVVFPNGNVGVGTTNPGYPLTVTSTRSGVGGEDYGQQVNTYFSAADSNYKAGIRTNTYATHTSGTQTYLIGMMPFLVGNGSGGTTSHAINHWARNDPSTGHTFTNSYGYYASNSAGAGAIGAQYGLFVEPLAKGSSNYAVFTNGTTPSYFGGNVGIGTLDPLAKLTVNGKVYIDNYNFGGAPIISLAVGDNDTGLNSTSDGALDIWSNSERPMSFRNTNVGIGTTAPAYPLDVNGTINTRGAAGGFYAIDRSGGATTAFYRSGGYTRIWDSATGDRMLIDSSGNTTITGSLTQNSDERLKREIKPVTDALKKLSLIKGVTYYWKNPKVEQTEQLGVIAQDVEKAFPQAVKIDEKGIRSVAYQNLIGPVISAINDLKNWVQGHDARITALEDANRKKDVEIAALRAAVCEINPKAAVCRAPRQPASK
ncbi:MAG: tail fiber domain-containing protein, partial [Proteobacteria bacterium]